MHPPKEVLTRMQCIFRVHVNVCLRSLHNLACSVVIVAKLVSLVSSLLETLSFVTSLIFKSYTHACPLAPFHNGMVAERPSVSAGSSNDTLPQAVAGCTPIAQQAEVP